MEKTVMYERIGENHKRIGVYPKVDAIKRGNRMMGSGKWVTLIKDGLTSEQILTDNELVKYIEK